MNPVTEKAVKDAIEHAARSGRFTADARALLKTLFEFAHPNDLPPWLFEGFAAVPEEVEFFQECLIAQEETLKQRLSQRARPRTELFFDILGRLGSPQGVGEAEKLLDAARNRDARIRGLALLRLGECSCDGCGQMILEGLEDPEPYVRKCAVEAVFKSLGERGSTVWERVLSSERDPEVREAALLCLARSGERGRDILRRLSGSLGPRETCYISKMI